MDCERSGNEALMQQTEEERGPFPKFWQDENLNQRIELQRALFSVLEERSFLKSTSSFISIDLGEPVGYWVAICRQPGSGSEKHFRTINVL